MADPEREKVAKSNEVLGELRHLKIKLAVMEKDNSIYQKILTEHFQGGGLDTERGRERRSQQNEKLELRQKIDRIKLKVERLRRTLTEMKTDPLSIEKIRETLEEIEGSILTLKEKQKHTYEELLKQERLVWQEVTAHKRQIESWTTSAARTDEGHMTGSHTIETSEKENQPETKLPPAVTEFQNFLCHTGGHTGGWEEIDDKVFMKLWTKHKGNEEALMEEAVREIPSQSMENIKEHVKWYRQYVTLQTKKKRAIAEWREEREVERRKKVTANDMEKKDEDGEKIRSKDQQLLEKERKEKKLQLEKWKEEQKAQRELEAAEREEAKKRGEAIKEKQKQTRQAYVKKQAQEYAKKKDEERKQREQLEREEQEIQKEKAKAANKHIQHFQLRDTRALQARQDQLSVQREEEEAKRERLEKLRGTVVVRVDRDPSRLLKPTSVWEERQKGGGEGPAMPLLSIPKRATPTWRQNL